MKTTFAACLLLSVTFAAAQQHQPNFDTERKEANDLYLAGKLVEALPLYEDLCKQDQTIAVFAERHGSALMRKAGTLPEGPEHQALMNQGLAEYRRAQKLGDNSDLVTTVLAGAAKSMVGSAITGIPLTAGYLYQGTPEAKAILAQAEIAFNRQDIAGALALYDKAAAADPKLYNAALFSGDMSFRLNDTPAAGKAFARAVAIDPDRETAWRYWGDALYKSGDHAGARLKYEQAVLAEPYVQTAWLALQRWARASKAPFTVPQIAVPKFNNKDGVPIPDPALDVPASVAAGLPAWRPYLACRAKQLAANTKFGFAVGTDGSTHPTGPYHTLAEETACFQATLVDLKSRRADGSMTAEDPGLKLLEELNQAGMLQCWIMLNHADQQVRFDYPTYRKDHRDLLVRYFEKIVIAGAATS